VSYDPILNYITIVLAPDAPESLYVLEFSLSAEDKANQHLTAFEKFENQTL
jgi:hypothetical protein